MGGARETALASSTYAPFTWRLLTFTGWNWKCHVIIVIKTDLSGFVVPMHSGLCEQYVKSLGYALRIWLPVSHAPSCIGTTNPSWTGLNPLNHAVFLLSCFLKLNEIHKTADRTTTCILNDVLARSRDGDGFLRLALLTWFYVKSYA